MCLAGFRRHGGFIVEIGKGTVGVKCSCVQDCLRSEDYAVFINADGNFICAKAFKNCLSIGAGIVSEFPTFAEAVEACETDIVERSEVAFYGHRDKMMTVSDYAKKHGVDTSTVRHKISRGLLPAIKIGKMWLIKESEPWFDNRRKNKEN